MERKKTFSEFSYKRIDLEKLKNDVTYDASTSGVDWERETKGRVTLLWR